MGILESPQVSLVHSQVMTEDEFFFHPLFSVSFLVISLKYMCRFVNLSPNLKDL